MNEPEFETDNIDQIVERLFSQPVQPPNSIQMVFPDSSKEDAFKQLLLIFAEGMKYFFAGEDGKVDLAKISESEFQKVNEYFKSFGYQVLYQLKPPNDATPPDFVSDLFAEYFILKTSVGTYYITFRSNPLAD